MGKELSYAEKVVLAILQDQSKGMMNAGKIRSRLPDNANLDNDKIYKALLSLTAKKLAEQPTKGNFRFVKPSVSMQGFMEFSRSGDSWVVPESKEITEDLYIPEEMRNGALPGDLVQAETISSKRKTIGRVTRIIKRSEKPIVGTIDIFENQAWLQPDKKFMVPEIRIKSKVSNDVHGYKASVKIIEFAGNQINPTGELLEILGKAGTNEGEMHSIIAEFGFSVKFPDSVIEETQSFENYSIEGKELNSRKDFRQTLTITIDPADAKDFDDAISFRKISDNLFEIGVHIADVSHFVQQRTALDNEALRRGTSVYLADRTIPMLPEILSNNLCSLRPNEDKLAFSVIMELDETGTVQSKWFGKTIIHSKRRFSYEEAQERIEKGTGDLWEELRQLNRIAKNLTKERFAKGAMSFESDEVKFEMDPNGKPLKVFLKKRFDAHKLIEEFMLLANKEVARFVKTKQKPELPFIYRSHDSPTNEKLVELSRFCQLFGYKLDIQKESNFRHSLNKVLKEIEGKPEEDVILQMAIRSMAKAIYTGLRSDHFGLAFDYYSHFTSPIRRYPDLLAHRLLHRYLTNETGGYNEMEIEAISKQSSATEQKAAEAERASTKYKMAEYLSERIGNVYEAVVSGVTEWGIFAEIIENHCEGMIRINDMRGDRFVYLEKEKKVMGMRSRKSYHLGDVISIRIKNANPQLRIIDFTIADNF
ncbi:MAG: ribonuclease R [Bacteroidetes bacterium]|nr:ribonuclease R [Bacteroidota bacterium]